MLDLLKSQGLAGSNKRILCLVLSYMACQASTTKMLICMQLRNLLMKFGEVDLGQKFPHFSHV